MRGIECWLAERGPKLLEIEFEGGTRLALFEQTPPFLPKTATDMVFGDEVQLLQVARTTGQVCPGESVHLVLIWQAESDPSFDYSVFVHLLDAGGRIYRQVDGSPVSGLRPMSAWAEGEIVTDRYGFLLPDDCPEGVYRLAVGVYRWDTLERLSIVDADGTLLGDALDLGEIAVTGSQ